LLVAIAISAIVPQSSWLGSREVSAAMAAKPAPIDGKRAFSYLEKICALGPRVAGSQANTRQREQVAAHWKAMGASVREQPFTGVHPVTGHRVDMVNLIGSWHPERQERVVIGAHYDTRPHPDEETDPSRRDLPFLGANDGASGVALLMEIANHLETMDTPWGVDLVIFDGEELVFGRHPDTLGEYFLGSKEFARAYVEDIEARRKSDRYVAGLVLDMVGGRKLQINQEPHSLNLAPDLVRDVWAVARQVDAKGFHLRVGREVLDDHLALNNAGIPAIDLVDFDYAYWHKADDLPKNCSADSLAEVGRVVTAWLAQPKRRSRR
jgi:acetylornithine deacetylase/succinyl-diaminopimelate desuccinylase-like protein